MAPPCWQSYNVAASDIDENRWPCQLFSAYLLFTVLGSTGCGVESTFGAREASDPQTDAQRTVRNNV
jgi:hypothetical protein